MSCGPELLPLSKPSSQVLQNLYLLGIQPVDWHVPLLHLRLHSVHAIRSHHDLMSAHVWSPLFVLLYRCLWLRLPLYHGHHIFHYKVKVTFIVCIDKSCGPLSLLKNLRLRPLSLSDTCILLVDLLHKRPNCLLTSH